jgi:hypothetical protein
VPGQFPEQGVTVMVTGVQEDGGGIVVGRHPGPVRGG